MKTPSLEEVKAYFKNAKEVGCLVFNNSKDISVLEIKEYNTVFTAEDNLGIAHLRVYDKKTNKYAEIISYKDKTNESAKKNPEFKQYKHIPTGIIGELMEDGHLHFQRGDNEMSCRESIWKGFIENSSDWEEVKPKEYEILSFSCNALGKEAIICKNSDNSFGVFGVEESNFINSPIHKIHSVKRLSDGEVFTVGDFIQQGSNWEITGFHQNHLGYIFIETKDISKVFPPLLKAIKANPVLFLTEDGVEIRKGDKFYVVDEQYGKFKMHDTIGGHFTKEHKHRKRFSSKEKASEYVLMNKPCLSVNDIVGKSKSSMISELVELAKSKISDQQ